MNNAGASNLRKGMHVIREPKESKITLAPGIGNRPPENNELCRGCQPIFHGRLAVHLDSIADPNSAHAYLFQVTSLPRQTLHSSMEELEACPCNLCHLFCSQFTPPKRQEWATRIGDRGIYWRFNSLSDTQVQVAIFMSQDTRETGPYSLLMKYPASNPNQPKPRALLPGTHTEAQGVEAPTVMLQQALSWLSDCVESHGVCGAVETQEDWLPTRLIHVGDDTHGPRLCLQNEVPKSSSYVALSYCWGGGPPLKLKRSNLDRLCAGLPMPQVPKTFLDAITITRGLGYEFLWVNSLCIIQDDENDWREECAKVPLIYKNAVCTISAIDSTNSKGGCFGDRDPRYLQPPTVQTYWTNYSSGLFLCVNPQHLWSRGVSESPLCRRGWALQEHVLSRRILHFGKQMLFWECRSKCASEAEPDGILTVESPTPSLLKTVASTGDAYDLWRTLVTKYSQSQLTNEKDKLVAISGVAKMINGMLNETSTTTSRISYHAGLWSPNLASQLLWNLPPDPSPAPTRPSSYRAPTWSWASIDGEVSLPATWEDPWVVVKSVVPNVKPLGQDPFQQIADASLDITGYLWKVGKVPNVDVSNRDLYVHYNWDNGTQLFDPIFEGQPLYLLPISGAKPQPFADNGAMHHLVAGLMVIPCDDSTGRFRRLGVFSTIGRAELVRLVSGQRNSDGICPRCMEDTGLIPKLTRLFSARRSTEAACPRCSDNYIVFTNLTEYFWNNKAYFAPLEPGESRALRLAPRKTGFKKNGLLQWKYKITLI